MLTGFIGRRGPRHESVSGLVVTLVSPQRIRVPVAGTHMPVEFGAYAETVTTGGNATEIPGGRSRLSLLASQESLPAAVFPLPADQGSDFSGANSSLSLGDLSAFVGTAANGVWQPEVTNANSPHSVTLASWSLFVATAGAYVPTLTTPSPSHFELTVGQAVADANFGVPNTTPVA
jgi:hypothetical protein